jgi:gliding motility-associated-like protein
MSLRVIIFFILLAPLSAWAQYVSPQGFFQLDEIKGCAPLTINFTNLKPGDCTPASPCLVKYEVVNTITDCDDAFVASGAVATQNPTVPYTINNPGVYRVIVLYQGFCDELTVTVTPSIAPAFDITTCGNNEVQVRVTDTNYDSYFIDFNDGTEVQVPSGPSATASHTYASAGIKNISVRGKDMNADDNCAVNTRTVNAVPALTAPVIDQLTVANNGTSLDLAFTNLPNVLYRLEIAINSTTFQLYETFQDVSTRTVSSINTDNNYYCFRLGAYDPCNNITVYSNTICSTNFDVVAQNNQNLLTWLTNTGGVSNFTVQRDGATVAATHPGSPHTDTNVACNVTYQYQVITNYANGSTSISSQKSVTAFSTNTPTAVNNTTAVVGNGEVALTWQQDPAFTATEYHVFRKPAGGSYNALDDVTTTAFTDAEYRTSSGYCYTINYTDACNNTSAAGLEVCPVRLQASLQSDNDIQLTWSAYTGWINGVDHYVVEKYDENGQLLATIDVGSATAYTEPNDQTTQVLMFRIYAFAVEGGLGESVSNIETVIKQPNIFYPRAFTPDGQGPPENEIFNVFGQYVVTFEMQIFNRWGELMFTTNDIGEGWDGKVKGKEQPEGTYAFIAHITDTAGRSFTRSGSVVLLRKK